MHLICRGKLELEAILWDEAQLMKSQCNSLWCLRNVQLRRLNKGVKFKGVLILEGTLGKVQMNKNIKRC